MKTNTQKAAIVLARHFTVQPSPHRPGQAGPHRAPAPGFRVVALLALLTCAATAQSWYTVDDFQYTPGSNAICKGLAKDPTGTIIYTAGYGQDAVGAYHGLIFQSSDGGANWSLLNDFADPTAGLGEGPDYWAGIAADSVGNLYASGNFFQTNRTTGGRTNTWVTRRSVDGGATWSTVDACFTSTSTLEPLGIAADDVGDVYVVGSGNGFGTGWTVRKGTGGTNWATVDQFAGAVHGVCCPKKAGVLAVGDSVVALTKRGAAIKGWTVRQSLDGGTNWATVDIFQLNSSLGAWAAGGWGEADGIIYVAGQAAQPVKKASGSVTTWVVRKSTDGGRSWHTVDSSLTPTSSLYVSAVGADAHGNVFVAGEVDGQWVVRESVGGTGPWQTVDTFLFSSVGASIPRAILGDSLGNIFVAGQAVSNTRVHWIVRKR